MALSYLRDHFKMSTINDKYTLRNRKLCLVLPKARTEYLQKSFAFSGSKIWNNLSENVKCSENLKYFKRSITSFASN